MSNHKVKRGAKAAAPKQQMKVIDLDGQLSDDQIYLKFWSGQKQRVSRAEIPKAYHPASDTGQFWLYPFGLVIEIVPGGFQFAHLWSPGDQESAEELAETFEGPFLDGSEGLPCEIRALSRGRKLIVWKAANLESLEALLGTYGQDHAAMLCNWLACWDNMYDPEARLMDKLWNASAPNDPKPLYTDSDYHKQHLEWKRQQEALKIQ